MKQQSRTRKIIVWIAVIAIILSFLAPLATFFFDVEVPADINIDSIPNEIKASGEAIIDTLPDSSTGSSDFSTISE